MKERGILFKAEMVRAILDGRKKQTRRICKVQCLPGAPRSFYAYDFELVRKNGRIEIVFGFDGGPEGAQCVSPFGRPGDRLWVRETWADVNSPGGPAICYRADKDVRTWEEFSETFGPDYGAGPSMDYDAYPGEYCMWYEDLLRRDEHKEPGYSWKPSLFMPRWASRIDLLIKGVRVERLQNINEEDAFREGINEEGEVFGLCQNILDNIGVAPGANHDIPRSSPAIAEFKNLWDSINGKKTGSSWSDNPWVFVYDFERVKP